MNERSCLVGLATGLEPEMVEGSASRALFEYHRTMIQWVFSNQPDVPLHQDSVAGFLVGFVAARTYLVQPGSLAQECMAPVLGGVLLVGRYLPLGPAWTTAGREFLAGLAAVLDGWDAGAGVAVPLVREAFAAAGDVPVTAASLCGFCLGVLYAEPYLLESGADPRPVLAAACRLAGVPA
jgi:hypothetical protein